MSILAINRATANMASDNFEPSINGQNAAVRLRSPRSWIGTRVSAPAAKDGGLFHPGQIVAVRGSDTNGVDGHNQRDVRYAVRFDDSALGGTFYFCPSTIIGPASVPSSPFTPPERTHLSPRQRVYVTHNNREIAARVISHCATTSTVQIQLINSNGSYGEEVNFKLTDIRLLEARRSARLLNVEVDFSKLASGGTDTAYISIGTTQGADDGSATSSSSSSSMSSSSANVASSPNRHASHNVNQNKGGRRVVKRVAEFQKKRKNGPYRYKFDPKANKKSRRHHQDSGCAVEDGDEDDNDDTDGFVNPAQFLSTEVYSEDGCDEETEAQSRLSDRCDLTEAAVKAMRFMRHEFVDLKSRRDPPSPSHVLQSCSSVGSSCSSSDSCFVDGSETQSSTQSTRRKNLLSRYPRKDEDNEGGLLEIDEDLSDDNGIAIHQDEVDDGDDGDDGEEERQHFQTDPETAQILDSFESDECSAIMSLMQLSHARYQQPASGERRIGHGRRHNKSSGSKAKRYTCTFPGCDQQRSSMPSIEAHIRTSHLNRSEYVSESSRQDLDDCDERQYYVQAQSEDEDEYVHGRTLTSCRNTALNSNARRRLNWPLPAQDSNGCNNNNDVETCNESDSNKPKSTTDHAGMARPATEEPAQHQISLLLSAAAQRESDENQTESMTALNLVSKNSTETAVAIKSEEEVRRTEMHTTQHDMSGGTDEVAYLSNGNLSPPESLQLVEQSSRFQQMQPSFSTLAPPSVRRIREGKKCRRVYGLEQRDMWCTQCKWKKACVRFGSGAATLSPPSSMLAASSGRIDQQFQLNSGPVNIQPGQLPSTGSQQISNVRLTTGQITNTSPISYVQLSPHWQSAAKMGGSVSSSSNSLNSSSIVSPILATPGASTTTNVASMNSPVSILPGRSLLIKSQTNNSPAANVKHSSIQIQPRRPLLQSPINKHGVPQQVNNITLLQSPVPNVSIAHAKCAPATVEGASPCGDPTSKTVHVDPQSQVQMAVNLVKRENC